MHCLLLVAVSLGALDGVYNDADRRLGMGADFFALYHAGFGVDHGCSVYDYHGCPSPVPYFYVYVYPPFLAVSLGQLLTVLPPWGAYWVWFGVLEAAYLAGAALTIARAPSARRQTQIAWLWATCSPYYLEVFMGQFSFLMGSLAALAVGALVAGRGRTGAAAWTGALLLKTNSVLLTPLFAALRRWRTLFVAGAVFALANFPYFVAVRGSLGRLRDTSPALTDPAPVHAGALGIQPFVSLFSEPGGVASAPESVRLGVSLAIIVGTALIVVAVVIRNPDPILGAVALMALHFIVYPDVWEHHYSMMLPLVALAVALRPLVAGPLVAFGLALNLPTPYLLFERLARGSPRFDPDAPDPQPVWGDGGVVLYHLWKIVPLLAILVVVTRAMYKGTPGGRY